MDPVSIAASVVGVLLPYVSKGADEFVKAVGKSAAEAVTGMVTRLKARWSGDEEAKRALESFEAKPDRYRQVFEEVLAERLKADTDLAEQLAASVEALGPQIHVVQKMTQGTDITGLRADHMIEGKAQVTQEIERASGVTGADIKKIGR